MKQIIIFIASLLIFIVGCCNNESKRDVVSINSSSLRMKKSDSTLLTNYNSSAADTVRKDRWSIAKIEDQTLIFSNGKKIKTSLFALKYIGQLKTKSKIPYFILSGRSCKNCDENIAIYIWSPSDGEMKTNGRQAHYSYPGREQDYLTHELVYENRMFYGGCLGFESCAWMQRKLNDKKVWEISIFIVKVENDTLQEINLDKPSSEIRKIKDCSELPGVDNTTEP